MNLKRTIVHDHHLHVNEIVNLDLLLRNMELKPNAVIYYSVTVSSKVLASQCRRTQTLPVPRDQGRSLLLEKSLINYLCASQQGQGKSPQKNASLVSHRCQPQ